MGREQNPLVLEVLTRFGIDPSLALWDCHGTQVIYHRYCELIAEKAGIRFSEPALIYHDPKVCEVVILVTGSIPDAQDGDVVFREEWSYGEVSPKNNKNSYPWAMAEKRAKDRVILKLVGLAGHVYSEEEADEFKRGGGSGVAQEQQESASDQGSVAGANPATTSTSPHPSGGYRFPMDEMPTYKSGKHIFSGGPHRADWDNWTWKQMAALHLKCVQDGNVTADSSPIENMLENGQYVKGWNKEQAEKIHARCVARLPGVQEGGPEDDAYRA